MRYPDLWLLIPALSLSLIGLIVVYSIAPDYFTSQILFTVLGLGLFLFLVYADFQLLQGFSMLSFGFLVLMLVITLIFGRVTRGSNRWIGIGSFRLQISEFIKPFIILMLSYLSTILNLKAFGQFLVAIGIVAAPAVLVFLQPDLGSTVMIVAVGGYSLLAMGARARYVVIALLLGGAILPLGWYTLAPYQQQRIETFLNPTQDPLGASYNQIQAVIAAGSGQWLGKGLGKGTQSHLQFLPERHTDFIFASLAEELGFLGSVVVIGMYAVLSMRLLWLTQAAERRDVQVVFMGVFILFLVQAAIHIGINIGILPVKGLTLPFVSVGGSSTLASWIALGLAASASQSVKHNRAVFLRY